MSTSVTLEKIVSLCKRRGFVFPAAEIYGGLNGVYDFGPLGFSLRESLKNAWKKHMTSWKYDIVCMDGSLLAPEMVWKASGHVENFHDPMIDCLNCKKRYRTDEVDLSKNCPHCGQKKWTDIRQFNMMFKTHLGALEEASSIAYLRPETAQALFINFKNVMTTNRLKIPFGIGQVGKAFRNEITPKQFLFRLREFEQMEMEFFCKGDEAATIFNEWVERRFSFFHEIGIKEKNIRLRPHEKDELAHYAQSCTDVEYHFPFGWKELEGIANRSNFDLTQHSKFSSKDLAVFDETTKESYIPHVVETSIGVDRLFLTVLFDAYKEDEVEGEPRISLSLHPSIAPIKAAFLPLTKQQNNAMHELYLKCKSLGYSLNYDPSGSIGKRYRRQDEIGTPVCFTYDFESESSGTVTARNRDTLQQERISIESIPSYLAHLIKTNY